MKILLTEYHRITCRDVSFNSLSGDLPQSLKSLKSLKKL